MIGSAAGKGGVNGVFHVVVVPACAARAVAVKGHGQHIALCVKGDGGPADQYIDFRQLHAVRTGITGWKDRGEGIAALLGGFVPFAVRLPRHAGYGDRLRGGFGVVGHGVPGRPQRGGQGQIDQPRTRWDGLIFHRLVQPVKGRDGDRPRVLRFHGSRLRFHRRGRVPAGCSAVLVRLLIAHVADVAAGRPFHGLYVAAGVVMLPALMGTVQPVTLLPVRVARVAVRGRLLRALVQCANQLGSVAVRRVFMFAVAARYGLHTPQGAFSVGFAAIHLVAASIVMGRVVFTQAPGSAGRPLGVGRGPQLPYQQRDGQQRRPYPFPFSQHKSFPPVVSYAVG